MKKTLYFTFLLTFNFYSHTMFLRKNNINYKNIFINHPMYSTKNKNIYHEKISFLNSIIPKVVTKKYIENHYYILNEQMAKDAQKEWIKYVLILNTYNKKFFFPFSQEIEDFQQNYTRFPNHYETFFDQLALITKKPNSNLFPEKITNKEIPCKDICNKQNFINIYCEAFNAYPNHLIWWELYLKKTCCNTTCYNNLKNKIDERIITSQTPLEEKKSLESLKQILDTIDKNSHQPN